MSRGINKVTLIGYLGNDPEIRYTPLGTAITNARLATTSVWKDKNGMSQEKTEWHYIVLFNRRAEVAKNHLKKGSKVYIEGSLQTRKWQDKDGIDRYITEVLAKELQFLDARGKHNHHLSDEEISSEDYQMLEQSDEEFFRANAM